jgi:hypothetical protein
MHNTKDKQCIRINNSSDKLVIGNTQLDSLTPTVDARIAKVIPWFQRFIFIIFIAKGRGKINLWLKSAIDSSSRANQFELGSDPDSVS